MAQELLANNRGGPSRGRVAALVTFAGTLLERPPPGARRRKKTENEDVSRHCRFLVALLCAQLSGRQDPTKLASSQGKNTREDKKPAQICFSNIFMAKAVADAIRSRLGPKGMDKMIQDGRGDVTITNGATILKQTQALHPTARVP
eukprot:bmy_20429T0